ncbi:hypothetical protein [Defluviimonas sp. SAOS-178_SWC]|uniref:hypothetical protein n=1 Tax=Defluviimonas sp. SAOS-178_SWC TaxID=3121287 RepID=UPI003221F2A9
MADQSFPQIPSTVWWGVREILQRSPRAKIDESMLAATLSVQSVAAKQYIVELKKVGLLDDEGRGTPLANAWRMDESYAQAVDELANACYPEGLVTIAPPGNADRQRVVNWFMTQGLGAGTAGNKAATYLMITSPEPGAAGAAAARGESKKSSSSDSVATSTSAPPIRKNAPARKQAPRAPEGARVDSTSIPLNLNVQIHISADASSEQIETIFSAMRKYLRND